MEEATEIRKKRKEDEERRMTTRQSEEEEEADGHDSLPPQRTEGMLEEKK